MRKRVFLIMALAMVVLAHAGTIRRVSLAWDGSQPNGSCFFVSISANGRFVLFYSDANNLVPGDNNGKSDFFVRDMMLDSTVRVSIGQNGQESNTNTFYGVISPDGRYVAFDSDSTNLVPEDTNGKSDVFLRDLVAGTTTLVSIDPEGRQFSNSSYSPEAILSEGPRVVFHTAYRRPGDSYERYYAFIRDVSARSTSILSYSDKGLTVYPIQTLRFSENGRFLAYEGNGIHLVDLWKNSVIHYNDFIEPYPDCSAYAATDAVKNSAIPGPPRYLCLWNSALAVDGSLIFINYTRAYYYDMIDSRNFVQQNGGALTPLGNVGLVKLRGIRFSSEKRYVAVSLKDDDALYLLEWMTEERIPVSRDMQGRVVGVGPEKSEFATHAPVLAFSCDSDNLVWGDTNQKRDVFLYEWGELPPPAVSISVSGSVKDGQGRGVEGVKLEFDPGGSTTSTSSGQYAMKLFSPWSGTITPSRTATQFVPEQRSLVEVASAQEAVDFRALLVTPEISVERREDRSWMRRKSYNRVAMTVVNETTWAVTGLRLYRSKGSAAEELVRQFLPAELKDNQVTFDDLGIVASGTYKYRFLVDLSNGDSIPSVVVADHG